jgi:Tol biopolymer transport system component
LFITSGSGHEVHFVDIAGKNDTTITTGWRPRISPDGNFISFNRDGTYPNGQYDNIYVRDLTAKSDAKVVNNTDYIVATNWMTDSQHIVLDAVCSIYRINRDGSNVVSLTQNHNCYDDAPSVNPVDGRIGFHNQVLGGIYLIDAGGTNAPDKVPNTQVNDWWASWSADGQWLSFLRGANYYKIRPDGSGLTQLTFSDIPISGINDYNSTVPWSPAPWSSDGKSLVGPRTVNGVQGIYAIATDGSGAMTVIEAAPAGAWVDFVGSVFGSPTVIRDLYLPIIEQ